MTAEEKIIALTEAKIAEGMRPRDATLAVLKENVELRQQWVEESNGIPTAEETALLQSVNPADGCKTEFEIGDRVAIQLPDRVAGNYTHGRITADDGSGSELRYTVELERPDGAEWRESLTDDGSPKLLPKVPSVRLSESMIELDVIAELRGFHAGGASANWTGA